MTKCNSLLSIFLELMIQRREQLLHWKEVGDLHRELNDKEWALTEGGA